LLRLGPRHFWKDYFPETYTVRRVGEREKKPGEKGSEWRQYKGVVRRGKPQHTGKKGRDPILRCLGGDGIS